MSDNQYTIRSIPPKLDKSLRKMASLSGKSLNQIVIESMAKGAGVSLQPESFDDLDWFIGGQSLDENFGQAIEWLDSLPRDIE